MFKLLQISSKKYPIEENHGPEIIGQTVEYIHTHPFSFEQIFIVGAVSLVSVLIGAWIGSRLAATNNKIERDEEIETKHIAAGQLTLTILELNINTLVDFYGHIKPYEADPYRWASTKPTSISRKPLEISVESLNFITVKMKTDIVHRIRMEEDNFFTLIDHIQHRSELKLRRFNPLIEEIQKEQQKEFDSIDALEAMREFVEKHSLLARELKTETDGIFKYVKKGRANLINLRLELIGLLSEMFPHHNFTKNSGETDSN